MGYKYLEDEPNVPTLHSAKVKQDVTIEEYWVLRGIKTNKSSKIVFKEKEFKHEPTYDDIAEMLTNKNVEFVSIEHNFRTYSELPFD